MAIAKKNVLMEKSYCRMNSNDKPRATPLMVGGQRGLWTSFPPLYTGIQNSNLKFLFKIQYSTVCRNISALFRAWKAINKAEMLQWTVWYQSF